LLQIDQEFIDKIRQFGFEPHIETNGTIPWVKDRKSAVPFITLSPKVVRSAIKLRSTHTLKILWPPIHPNITPESFEGFKAHFRCIQPLSLNIKPAIEKLYELERKYPNDHWYLSPQLHKLSEFREILK